MKNKAVKKILSVILTVCLALTLAPFGASAQEISLATSDGSVEPGALSETGWEPQPPPATPSDLPQFPLADMGPLAAAVATARAFVYNNALHVRLTEGAFADGAALDKNQWTLDAPGGHTITHITRVSDTLVSLVLSKNIILEHTFCIRDVSDSQFALGTTAFSVPLEVEIKAGAHAEGTASAGADTSEITVALTKGEFQTEQLSAYWSLGGDSAVGKFITAAQYIDINTVKLTLNNPIGAGGDLTVTAAQIAFLDIATWVFASPLTVAVSAPSAACSIGTAGYASLSEALAAVKNGETIKLLGDITHTSSVEVDNMEIVFDPNGYSLLIDTGATKNSTALTVTNGGNVGYNTLGTFTVCGGENGYGVLAQHGGRAAVGGVLIKNDYNEGAYASGEDSRITVNGDILTVGAGDGGYARAAGAAAAWEAKITVNGSLSVTGDNAVGVMALGGGEVEVNPPGGGTGVIVRGYDSVGVEARNDPQSKATVNGDVEVQGDGSTGVAASFGQVMVRSVTVAGDDSFGAHAVDYGLITINGDVTVTGNGVNGVRTEKGEGAGGAVRVTGSIDLGGTGEANTGIYCSSEGTGSYTSVVTVDGSVTAPLYLALDGQLRGKEPPDGADGIYAVYTGRYGSVVKVAGIAGPSLPIVTTTLVSPAEVTATGARVRGGVTATGGAEITAFGFAWGFHADPTTANSTAAGTGTAAGFAADLSGLVPNQIYYVRAYATNSAGTAYGENRTFTTAASDPLGAPLNLRYLAYDGAVELMWDAPPSASPILCYEILRGNDLTKPWTDVGNVTSYRVSGLTNGDNIFFNIRAVNAAGPGPHGSLWAMANIPTPPGPPHSLSASGINGKVRVSWSAPYSNGHREITGYLVSLDSVNWTDAGRNTSCEFTGLTDGVTYTFYVRAANEIGVGEAAPVQGSSRSTGGGSVGGGAFMPVIAADKQPNMPTTAKVSVSGTVKGGILSATISEQMVKDAVKAAQDAAKESGKEPDGIALDFNITGSGRYIGLNAVIDAAAIDRLKEAGVRYIKIGSSLLDVTFDTEALAEIDRQSTGAVTISAARLTKLPDAAKKLIGNRPAFNITVSYRRNGQNASISNFGKGAVTLGFAYKATGKEKTGSLFGVYVDQDGRPQLLANSSYAGGRLIFRRNSLSTYGVGYKTTAPAFTDTGKHWARDSIDFVASRGLISGTGTTIFAPNAAITRADFIMALGRLSGADVNVYPASGFTDVKSTDPAMPYIEWAVRNKIVQGTGGGRFGPALSITRQDMAVMMRDYAKATGYKLPVSIAAVTFADSAKISAYAGDAVKAIQQAGIMQGKANNIFDPQGNVTRAEASAILRRFVELVIDEGTARGRVQNDAGQWRYVGENGKPSPADA
ncbi:MAG TPA: S-layer homology domain-containing protein [Feifaniaceae bacterium]|nr:S-layer homology domain-containing protein [Feifaniaceae bacterium]